MLRPVGSHEEREIGALMVVLSGSAAEGVTEEPRADAARVIEVADLPDTVELIHA